MSAEVTYGILGCEAENPNYIPLPIIEKRILELVDFGRKEQLKTMFIRVKSNMCATGVYMQFSCITYAPFNMWLS